MYDAIVIGARCAGAPTAMLLARKGYKVLLVDRSTFPSDIPHGHFIHRHGPKRLHQWELLDRIVASGCPAITSFTTDFGDYPLTGRDLSVDGVAFGYGPRRSILDQILVEAAVEAGAELRDGFTVEDVTTDGDRITGIRGHDRRGTKQISEEARLTIGADGRNSHLAKFVQPEITVEAPAETCWYFSYWSGVTEPGLGVYIRGRHVIFAFPTSDDLFAIFVAWPKDDLARVRADIEREFLAVVDLVPELSAKLRGGAREERWRGATDLPNYLRKPHGPGWALAGDAGCHKDPYLALGVCDAFRDADLLSHALDEGFSGARPIGDALADFERSRNEATIPEFHQNLSLARFEPPPAEQIGLRQLLRGNQAATNQFYMAIEGMIPPETFFNPTNMQRLTA